jgi:tetratricopeptide (TPR) repeat protein
VAQPALAQEPCREPNGAPAAAVAHLVSMAGDVRINGRRPTGELPHIVICPSDSVTVGSSSRAAVYLLGADTPLRLDENTVSRFEPPPGTGSGVVELVRGALYFLSEVRRTLSIRTPYVNAGVEGTEVYLRVRGPATPAAPAAELIVLEGRVTVTPGSRSATAFAPETATTGERVAIDAAGRPDRARLQAPGGPYGVLRRIAVGQLSWTLFYPDILVAEEAAAFPRIAAAARLLAAGQAGRAEAVLGRVPAGGREAGLRDALLATVAVARKDPISARILAERAITAAPASAAPYLALSYARQLATDLDGAFVAAERAGELAPRAPLPRARLAELHLMRGETRRARAVAGEAVRLGGGPLAQIALGYAELAALRAARAEAAFLRALQAESWNPLALMGLGLARIKQGDLAAGGVEIQNAVAHDPSSSLLRSYLGRAWFDARRDDAAGRQFAIGKELDPEDPTPWFYDAIRKQLANRPVEALRDLERSIELNDNRAPFRSRQLLAEDAATRGVSLGRIYDDLGFEQLGINEAARSLALDPANAAAHRFLSDLYRGQPRLELARASELLQAQLLQPLGLDPIQPSLAFTDLDIVAQSGLFAPGFNEFGQLFLRDGLRLDGTGVLGSDDGLRADEIAATLLKGRAALSVGQFHYETNGFRENSNLEHDILSAFGQFQVVEGFDLQLEYRRRDTYRGDRELSFDLDSFSETLNESIEEDVFRAGAHLSPGPGSDLLISGLYADRENDSDSELISGGTTESHDRIDIGQLEAQYIGVFGPARLVLGAGRALTDQESRDLQLFPGRRPSETNPPNSANATDVYLVTDWALAPSLDLSLRLGYDDVDLNNERSRRGTGMAAFTPGIGMIWQPAGGTQIRVDAGRTVKRSYVVNQTLRPTQLAGFNQLYDDLDGTRAEQVDLGVSQRLLADVTGGIQATWRWLAREQPAFAGQTTNLTDQRDDRLRAFVYWTPTYRTAVALEALQETFRRKDRDSPTNAPLRVDTFSVPLSAAYFAPSGWFVGGRTTLLAQDVESIDRRDEQIRQDDSGVLVDLVAGLRLPGRRGLLSFQVANLLDRQLSFQDETPWSSSDVNPRFIPSRTFLVGLTLNF